MANKRQDDEYVSVVYNRLDGRFDLSVEGKGLYKELSKQEFNGFYVKRHDIYLLIVVRRLGRRANTEFCDLGIIRIPIEFTNCYLITYNNGSGAEEVNISSELLVAYELKQKNINKLDPNECKNMLMRLQNINNTNYYEFMHEGCY